MVTVSAFQIEGLKLWFWSNDHEPPHFHVKKAGEWEVKISFMLDQSEMVEVEWSKKHLSQKVLKQVTKLAEEHRVALLEQWQNLRDSEGAQE